MNLFALCWYWKLHTVLTINCIKYNIILTTKCFVYHTFSMPNLPLWTRKHFLKHMKIVQFDPFILGWVEIGFWFVLKQSNNFSILIGFCCICDIPRIKGHLPNQFAFIRAVTKWCITTRSVRIRNGSLLQNIKHLRQRCQISNKNKPSL